MKHRQLICLIFVFIPLVVCSMKCQKMLKNVFFCLQAKDNPFTVKEE